MGSQVCIESRSSFSTVLNVSVNTDECTIPCQEVDTPQGGPEPESLHHIYVPPIQRARALLRAGETLFLETSLRSDTPDTNTDLDSVADSDAETDTSFFAKRERVSCVLQTRQTLHDMSLRRDEHPICKALPTCPCVEFVDSDILEMVSPAWPRNQELAVEHPEYMCSRPLSTDLVIAVSHMWYFEKHPDPFGEKTDICRELVQMASDIKKSPGRTFLFFDFLSLTQQPFHSAHSPRSQEQNESFQLALKAMPMIYLYSDIIVLLDSTPTRKDSSGEFGRASTTPSSERGWIYLERFIAMIKVAMAPEPKEGCAPDPVVLSNSQSLLDEILLGGQQLREAAKAGKHSLKEALQSHLQVLQTKTFSAISIDKQNNQGGVAGGPTLSVKLSDREVVFSTMNLMVEKLFKQWGSVADGKVFSYKSLVWEKARLATMCKRFENKQTR